VIRHPIFETASISLIIVNSIFLAMEDPTKEVQEDFLETAEGIFLYIYTLEMMFKILGLGFCLNRGSYMRDPWNLLDFTIVVSGYIPLFFSSGGGVNLSALRSLRVLRPLKTVTAIKKLRALILTIFNAVPYLVEIMVVLFFVFMIFAIAALQLFTGLLQNSCTDLPTGRVYIEYENNRGPFMCTSGSCPSIVNTAVSNYTQLVCAKNNENPDFGTVHFDNIFSSFLMIYIVTTMEGWSTIMMYVMDTMHFILSVFFIFIVFMCSFFLINLTLAVITIKFNESQENAKKEEIARIKHSILL
jgi:hypothetical protein